MKTIHLLRHAKSSWDDPMMEDIIRPLNDRGIRSATLMAAKLAAAGCNFDHVYCSPAIRTQTTISLIQEQLSAIDFKWTIAPELYTFDVNDLLEWFLGLDDALSECMIVGHNPALTDFCNHVSDANIENIPTCGYVQLVSKNLQTWSELDQTPFELKRFLWPKQFLKETVSAQ